MQTQNLDLNKMGLTPMSEKETRETDGGFLGVDDIAVLGIGLLITGIYELGKAYGEQQAHAQ